MTWRCVPVACWHKAPHIAAAAFGVLVAAHPMPTGRASCQCHMVWYPDAKEASMPPHDVAPSPSIVGPQIPPLIHVYGPGAAYMPPLLDEPLQADNEAPEPVPEPGTAVMIVTWLAVLAWIRRRRVAR